MARLTYTNSLGQSLLFGETAPIIVTKIEGLGTPKSEMQRQKSPYQDGCTIMGTTLAERELVLEGVILSEDRWSCRRQMIQAFNPKLKGILRYENGDVIKEIECFCEQGPVFPSHMQQRYQVFLLTLLCPSPFWMDVLTESREMTTWVGGLRFPLRLPAKFASKGTKKINIINQGDTNTPVRIEFRGPATNPRIINHSTGEYIQVNRFLVPGDIMTITTDFGRKRVEINGQNVFNWIDLASTFWQLQAGDNVIEYTSDDEVEPASVTVSYRNRYAGI